VGNDKNTFIHAVEEMADLPNRLSPEPRSLTVIDHDGQKIPVSMHKHFCTESRDVSRQFVNFEPALIACGAQSFGRLGNAEVRVVDAKKCRDVILRIFSHAECDLCVKYMNIPKEYYLP
jgi:aminoglycoside 3-N-acetyltransferase